MHRHCKRSAGFFKSRSKPKPYSPHPLKKMFIVCALMRCVQRHEQDPLLPLLLSVFAVSLLRCIELVTNSYAVAAGVALCSVAFDYSVYKAVGPAALDRYFAFQKFARAVKALEISTDTSEEEQEVLEEWREYKAELAAIVEGTKNCKCPLLLHM